MQTTIKVDAAARQVMRKVEIEMNREK